MPTKIEWCDETWNPIQDALKGPSGRGYHCTKCSPGCQNCYAEVFNRRFGNGISFDYAGINGRRVQFEISLKEFQRPDHWKQPRRIFIQSMGDIFHEYLHCQLIDDIIRVIFRNPRHTFIMLTKRIDRARIYLNTILAEIPLPNLQIGVSICVKDELPKIDILKRINLPVRFVSFEPLLEDIGPDLDLTGIQGVYVGGETGSRARPMHPDWVQNIWDHCQYANIPFFFKSWGNWSPTAVNYTRHKEYWFDDGQLMVNIGKKKSGRLFLGREWDEIPK